MIEGVASLPTTLADVVSWPGRAIQSAVGLPRGVAPSTALEAGLNLTGLPQPKTEEEKRNAEVVRGGSAMLTPMGVGAVAPQQVARLPAAVQPLVATPGPVSLPAAATQVVAGGTGALAGDVAANREEVPEWLKPTVRLAGNIVGAGGVSGAKSAAETLYNAATGVKSAIAQAFDRLGITPRTAASVTTDPTTRSAEAAFSKLPVSATIMQPKQQQVVDDFGRAVETTAQKISPAASAQEAGLNTQKLMHDWKEVTFPAEQAAQWGPLNQRMSGAAVDKSAYRAALEEAASPKALASMPENQRAFASAQAKKWLDALDADAPGNSMLTWEQAHAIKQQIGNAMGTPDLVAALGTQRLKSIYGGLAQGMETTATQHGQAGLFKAANDTTIAGHQFMDSVLSKAVKANNLAQETIDPAKAAKALAESNDAMVQLRQRIPEAADHIAAWQLRQAKEARAGQQGSGSTTSTGTFLTNLRDDQLRRPEGSAAMYGPVGRDLQDLMDVAAQLRLTEKNANTSNTAQAGTWSAIPMLAQQGYQHGGWTGALAAPLAALTANTAAAKYLTSPMALRIAAAQRGTGTPIRPGVTGLLGDASAQPDERR